MTPRKTLKKPLSAPRHSVQYDLFSQFVSNNAAEVSNAVEIWDNIPKYFFTPQQVSKLRSSSGHADPFEWSYTLDGKEFSVRVQPSLIEQDDGSYKAFFPGATEELVEEALKKILADQNYGLHDPAQSETWVRFTLNMVRRELKQRGRARSVVEIKQAIEVMASSVLSVYVNGKRRWKGTILQDLVTVGRDEYLADSEAHHRARLPLFISRSINHLEFRQFNLDRLLSCDEQLSRWIYRKLIHRYKQASLFNDYHFNFSTIADHSGLLQQGRPADNRRKVRNALEELKERGVVMTYDEAPLLEGRKVIDARYTVKPTSHFITEQKAANKRSTDALQAAGKAGLAIKPKS